MSVKLVEAISEGKIALSEIGKEELESLIEYSVANADYRALEVISNSVTGIFDYSITTREWLKSHFESPNWKLVFTLRNNKQRAVKIEWNKVILDDASKLTDDKNKLLLNSFKHWILASDDPLTNGGKLIKSNTAYENVNVIIRWINAILLNGSKINISSLSLTGITEDFLMALLVNLAVGKTETGFFEFPKRVKHYLLQNIEVITDEEADLFRQSYSFVTRNLLAEEMVLNLSLTERVKACCWLDGVGYYRSGKQNERVNKGNNNVLVPLIYTNQTLPLQASTFSLLEELKLATDKRLTEYVPLPNKNSYEVLSRSGLSKFLPALKTLHSINNKPQTCHVEGSIFSHLSVTRIREHVKVHSGGRTKTLPPSLVFDLIRNCFEYACEHHESILKSVLNVTTEGAKTDPHTKRRRKIDCKIVDISLRSYWVKVEAISLVEPDLIELGVKELTTVITDEDCFIKRRSNHALFDLYAVLIGSLQVLIGVFMAKRQSEVTYLKPHGNLYPNIDPSSEQGKLKEYKLIATLRKTGNGGKNAQNATIKRPIPHSIASIIWKLEKFNVDVAINNRNEGTLALFNNLHAPTLSFSKVTTRTFSANFDMVCDYFETPLVNVGFGEFRRFYVRQHQLRRFFAMVFFWSKGYDGLDTLRWMMGHSDIEHLYHYISESDTGAVLNGVKASYLTDALHNRTLENIDALADSISKRFGVAKENISMSTMKHAVEDYKVDFKTIPTIEQLEKQATKESQILGLLEDGTITLEPEFFTFSDCDNTFSDFTLVLQIHEVD
jgi:hypothetical protein